MRETAGVGTVEPESLRVGPALASPLELPASAQWYRHDSIQFIKAASCCPGLYQCGVTVTNSLNLGGDLDEITLAASFMVQVIQPAGSIALLSHIGRQCRCLCGSCGGSFGCCCCRCDHCHCTALIPSDSLCS